MRLICTLFLLLFTLFSDAQSLTGIWRGYFAQKSFGFYEERYKLEVQLDHTNTNAIKGVTYSYKTTVFYGKAAMQGLFTKKTKNLLFKETRLMEVKIRDKSEPCLMTYYLEYSKIGNFETLSGTYTSENMNNKGDCGYGTVYLERVVYSDFKKEEFLLEKERRDAEAKKKKSKDDGKNDPPTPKSKFKPGAEDALISKKDSAKTPTIPTPPTVKKPDTSSDINTHKPEPPKAVAVPKVIKDRENTLVKKLTTAAKEIKIDLYDNGEIDNDTITVFHNNELIASNRRLSATPISFTIKIDKENPRHEFVMVAENLGSIPPNTATMVITAGNKRYELFLTSTEQKNAVVVIEYKPD
jgi:hypothetical protein